MLFSRLARDRKTKAPEEATSIILFRRHKLAWHLRAGHLATFREALTKFGFEGDGLLGRL